ncbi:MAG TPA: SRPBCC domain-containing protein [Steroidobacteraceae bacterium]
MKPAGRTAHDPLVRIEQVFDAPREQVFDAWVRKELLEEWYAPEGCALHIVRLDVREGGGYHWCIHDPSFGECWTIGTYLEVRRPERLVFTSIIADADGVPRTPESQGHDPEWPPQTTIRVTCT